MGRIPEGLELGFLVALLAGLSGLQIIAAPRIRQWDCLLVGLCTFTLVGVDQHRLQPWVWQFFILSIVLATADSVTARAGWRWLVIGIYAWSAWSKLDRGFCVQHGPFLLEGLFKAIGLVGFMQAWPQKVTYTVAGFFPVFELLVAIGLSWSRTRRFAVLGAAMMHVGLLLALGPLGHDHRPGVLVWNAFFMVQNWILFGSQENNEKQKRPLTLSPGAQGRGRLSPQGRGEGIRAGSDFVIDSLETTVAADSKTKPNSDGGTLGSTGLAVRAGNWFAKSVVVAALCWPVLEPFGFCDHWPAWAVYAAKPERVTVFLAEEELSKLPQSMAQYLGARTVFDEWDPIRIDRWSLDAVYVPIYPQDRFQVGVALGLARDLRLNSIRIVIDGPANWWTGKPDVREYVGLESVEKLADSYRFNARPR
jgi:hypothetical protein